ncbi:MAG: prolyl oligopeptidase family serine peptidase [Halodesulfurarchaeum sp.]
MEPVTAADFHDIVQIASPRLSPDGEDVAFVRKEPLDEEEYEATIYLVDTADGEPRRFTVREGRDSDPRWSPSGDRIAFVSTRGADDDRPQLWVVSADGGEARQVTSVAGDVSEIAWHPDGSKLAFVQQVSKEDREAERDLEVPEDFEATPPDPRVIDRTVYRSGERYFDGKRSQIYLVDLADDSVEPVTDGDLDHMGPTWGGETLYYTASVGEDPDDSIEYEIVAADIETGEREPIYRTTGWGTPLAASADGRIAHVYKPEAQSTLRPAEIEVYDRQSGSVSRPTRDLDRTLGMDATIQWGPAEERLYFTTPDTGATALWSVPWDDTEPKAVARHEGSAISTFDVGAAAIVFERSDWDHPGDLFVQPVSDGETRRLTRVNAQLLDERRISRPEAIEIEGEAGTVQGWVLRPPDFDPGNTYPLAVEVHGGPHIMWTTSGSMWHEFQTLAARGYVVFWSNPRGSAGSGEAFSSAIERNWGAVTMADVMAGVEQVSRREYVDEENRFLTGGSFGGFLTGWMVGQTDTFGAAVAQRGVFSLTSFYGSTDGAYKLIEGDFDTTPIEEPDFLWAQSPTGHVESVATPTLIMQSDDDYRTPPASAELYYRLLRKAGVETRLVRYPAEGHELSRSGQPGHIVDRLERIVRWFDGYSDHEAVPPALERPKNDGLTLAENDTS